MMNDVDEVHAPHPPICFGTKENRAGWPGCLSVELDAVTSQARRGLRIVQPALVRTGPFIRQCFLASAQTLSMTPDCVPCAKTLPITRFPPVGREFL